MIDCIIPARGGSKGIPKKNIVLINKIPLIAYSIFVARKSKKINNIYVSTDSEEIANIAEFFGAKIPFLRPKHLASDTSSDKEVFIHFYENAKKINLDLTEEIVHLRPTTPGRDVNIVDKAIELYFSTKKCTSLRSAHESNLTPNKWFKMKDGNFEPLIQNYSSNEVTNMPRQYFPKVYIPNGYLDIVKFSTFKHDGKFHGNIIKSFITDYVIDIDLKIDLDNALKDKTIIYLAELIKQEYKIN